MGRSASTFEDVAPGAISAEANATPAGSSFNRRTLWLVGAACAIVAGLLASGVLVWRLRPAGSTSAGMMPAYVQVALPPGDVITSNGVDLAIARGGTRQFDRRLIWVDRQGKVEPLPAPVRPYRGTALSPDGKQIALMIGAKT